MLLLLLLNAILGLAAADVSHLSSSYLTSLKSDILSASQRTYLPPQKSYLPPQTSYKAPEPAYEATHRTYLPPLQSFGQPEKSYLPPTPKRSYLPPATAVVQHYELPTAEYLPPSSAPAPKNYYLPPVTAAEQHYEAPTAEYLPPAVQTAFIYEQSHKQLELEPAHQFAEDGYRYRTVRRYRFRKH